ncbi:hypothetical protein [Risungbinella massiliensis]|uniref:hypothetical protein n=1 Tax=Risungbinella massiliensis TaxID=1329796 RepID=UPI0005CC05D7|nr:hypothetical protein [Risungbinella massiliensis]
MLNFIQIIFQTPFLWVIIILNIIALIILGMIHRKLWKEQTLLEDQLASQLTDEMVTNTEFIHAFTDWLKDHHDISKQFRNSWNHFYRDYQRKSQQTTSFPDVYDYFLEEDFVQKRAWCHVFALVPGVFLAIGVLGTFWGLVGATGIIQASGSSWIGSIDTAIYCSIFGIFSSILWQFIDRFRFATLQTDFTRLRNQLDQVFPAQDIPSLLNNILEAQKQSTKDITTYMSDNLILQMADQLSLSMKTAFESVLVPYLHQSQTSMEQIVQNNKEQAATMKEMTYHAILLTEEMQQYAGHLSNYQSALESFTAKLKDTTIQNNQLRAIASDLLEIMNSGRKANNSQLSLFVESFQQSLAPIYEHIVQQNNLHQEYQKLAEQWNKGFDHIQTWIKENTEVKEKVTEQHTSFLEQQVQYHSLLSEIHQDRQRSENLYANLSATQQTLLHEKEQMSKTQARMQELLTEQLSQIDDRSAKMQEHWAGTHQLWKELNEQLSHSMEQFEEQMHQGLNHTFQQFDQELAKSINTFIQWISTLEQFPNHLETLTHHVGELNRKLDQTTDQQIIQQPT